jgi:hypothetical protein
MEEDVVDWETDRAVEVRNGCRLGIGLMVSVELGEKAMASTTREENATAADRLFIMLLFFLVVVAGRRPMMLLVRRVRFFFFTIRGFTAFSRQNSRSKAQIDHTKSTTQPWCDGRSATANSPPIPNRITPFNFQSSFKQHFFTICDHRSPPPSLFQTPITHQHHRES